VNLLSTLSFTSILGYLPWATAILRVNPFAGCFVRLSFARQFDRVSSGSRFQADADQRKLCFGLGVEAERDVVSQVPLRDSSRAGGLT